MANDYLEVYGTIAAVYPTDSTGIQKVLLSNANTLNVSMQVDNRVLLNVKPSVYPKPPTFTVGTPITAKGIYVTKSASDTYSYMHTIQGPVGYIRYNGKVYN